MARRAPTRTAAVLLVAATSLAITPSPACTGTGADDPACRHVDNCTPSGHSPTAPNPACVGCHLNASPRSLLGNAAHSASRLNRGGPLASQPPTGMALALIDGLACHCAAILPVGVQELPSTMQAGQQAGALGFMAGQQSASLSSSARAASITTELAGLTLTASAEVSASSSAGDKKLRLASTAGFAVGSYLRVGSGAANQEDSKVQYITGSSLWLSAPLEFNHNKGESAGQLSVAPECPSNCSSRAPCINAVCECMRPRRSNPPKPRAHRRPCSRGGSRTGADAGLKSS